MSRMNQLSTLALSVTLAGALAACGPQGRHGGGIDRETTGTVLGGIAGGFLGSQFGEGGGKIVASVAGALVGAWAGKQIANGMNQQDRVQYQQAAQQAQTAPVGQPVQWYNPNTGNSGSIVTTREGQTQSGEYCREFQQTITVGGQTEQAYGTACRQPDGSWKIVNNG